MLLYSFTGDGEVDLTSTFVPEAFRGRGVATLLAQVTRTRTSQTGSRGLVFNGGGGSPQAAMDFLEEEKLRARVSCWYVKKFMEEHPDQCRDLLIS